MGAYLVYSLQLQYLELFRIVAVNFAYQSHLEALYKLLWTNQAPDSLNQNLWGGEERPKHHYFLKLPSDTNVQPKCEPLIQGQVVRYHSTSQLTLKKISPHRILIETRLLSQNHFPHLPPLIQGEVFLVQLSKGPTLSRYFSNNVHTNQLWVVGLGWSLRICVYSEPSGGDATL